MSNDDALFGLLTMVAQGYHPVERRWGTVIMVYNWTALVAGSFLAGAALVWLLALKRTHQTFALLSGLGASAAGGWGLARLISHYGTIQAVVVIVLIALGCVAGGYGIASALLGTTARRGRTPDLAVAAEEAARSDTAVLVVACVEPRTYEPSAVALDIEHYSDIGLPEATVGMTPFLYAAQKTRYRAAGGESPALLQAKNSVVQLEQALDRDTFGWVDLVTCQPKDRLDQAIGRLVRRGYKRIVVTTISIAETFEFDHAKTVVDALRPEQHGISVTYASPLWSSDIITEMVAQRIWISAAVDPQTTGVALLMHGQPEAYQQSHGHFDVEENAFCNRIRMLLVEKGVPENNVRLCWMEWRPPEVTETVRHLAALGCTRILVVPACYPFDSMSTLLDLPMAVRQARVPEHVYVTTLGTWGEDPEVSRALKEVVLEAAAELD